MTIREKFVLLNAHHTAHIQILINSARLVGGVANHFITVLIIYVRPAQARFNTMTRRGKSAYKPVPQTDQSMISTLKYAIDAQEVIQNGIITLKFVKYAH